MSILLVGSYARADEPGIHAFSLDEAAGVLQPLTAFAGVENPSFVSIHPQGEYLYAVGETGLGSHGAFGSVHSFQIESDGAALELVPLNRRSSEGDFPCHLRFDRSGGHLAAANYGSGNAAVFPIGPDGALGQMSALVQHSGSGPNPARQEGPHAHATLFSPDNRLMMVTDLGIDRLVIYGFNAATGALARHGEIEGTPGSGPRHLEFHSDGIHLFVVNELDSTLTLRRQDPVTGGWREMQTVSTLPAGVGENTAADLHLSASGRYVYVSNRGHNSVAVFAFDPAAGLERIAVRPSGGDWPRGFAIAPRGHHLVVANRRSDEIVVLPLLDGGADIGEPIARAAVAQPSSVVFA